MMTYFIFTILVLLPNIHASNYDPTLSELSRYQTVINPSLSWGTQCRREQSIRILLLGGSITSGCCCPKYPYPSFSSLLEEYVVSNYKNSYVLNKAIAGVRPFMYLGDSYEFEVQPKSKWPNLIIIEMSLNSDISWSTAQQLDNLLFSYDEKWSANGLPRPDVLFLDLFTVVPIISSFKGDNTKENRIQHLNSFDPTNLEAFNRGSGSQIYINALARYYSYPVLSNTDMLWPAFCRHFIENPVVSLRDPNINRTNLWPYTFDGIHPTCLGHEFIANHVLIRFLKDQMNRPNTSFALSEAEEYQHRNIRMFPRSTYVTLIRKWNLWGRRKSTFDDFKVILGSGQGWDLTFLDNGRHALHDGHDCYGSRGLNHFKAVFKIDLPNQCEECKIGISYLHSWNRSYVGDVSCSLQSGMHNNSLRTRSVIETVKINGSIYKGVDVRASYPQETRFTTALSSGKYIVKCTKLDSKFACFSQVAVYLK